MTNYTVTAYADYDDFVAAVEAIATTTDIQVMYSQEKGYIVVVG